MGIERLAQLRSHVDVSQGSPLIPAQPGGPRNEDRGHERWRTINPRKGTYWELLSETNLSLGKLRCAPPAGTGKSVTRRAWLGAEFP